MNNCVQTSVNNNDETAKKKRIKVLVEEVTYEKMKRKALLNGREEDEFAGNLIRKGLRKRSERNPDKLAAIIHFQQRMDELIEELDEKDEVRERIIENMKEVLILWD